MYLESASADLTPQGKAIRDASAKFGGGERTLPFPPCKKGYIPILRGQRMHACFLHDKKRKQRIAAEGWKYREGETELEQFWVETNLFKKETPKRKDRDSSVQTQNVPKKST